MLLMIIDSINQNIKGQNLKIITYVKIKNNKIQI